MLRSRKYYLIFTIYFLLFGIVVGFISSIINYRFEYSHLDRELEALARGELSYKKNLLSGFIERHESILETIEASRLMTNYLENETEYHRGSIEELFRALVFTNKDIMQLRYLDSEGNEVVRVDRNEKASNVEVIKRDKLQNKSNRYYFKEIASLPSGELWHSNIDLNVENGKIEEPIRPTFRVGLKVMDGADFKGVLIVNLVFRDIIKLIVTSGNFSIYILDGNGEIIHNAQEPDKSWSKYLKDAVSGYTVFQNDIGNILETPDYVGKGVFSFSFDDLFENNEGIRAVAVPRISVVDKLRRGKFISALLIALSVTFISIPLSWLISIIPAKLQTRLYEAFDEISWKSEIIDKNVIITKSDMNGQIIEVSSKFSEITGYSQEEVIGKKHNILKHPETSIELHNDLNSTISSGNVWEGEIKDLTKCGKEFWLNWVISPELNKEGNIDCYIAVAKDITDKKVIEQISVTDTLTRLYNRRKLHDVLNHEIAMFDRYKNNFSVILLDIDNFKKINDVHGHHIGDEVLISLAGIFRNNARETDYLCRWGGEEFLIISSGQDLDGAYKFAEKIRTSVAAYDFEDVGKVTISCGVIQYRYKENISEVTMRVDTALYEAKKAGRNTTIKG